jgi:ubiquinone/menaquinone biosynthesis C-methylase UbiE
LAAPYYRALAAELALQRDDDLLEVGCGSATLLAEHARHVRYVAGLDASEIQVGMARRLLADRLAAGSEQIVLGDAGRLPRQDGRFSVVTSLNTLKFVPDLAGALREMHRVLRPGGRAVVTLSDSEPAHGRATTGARARMPGARGSGAMPTPTGSWRRPASPTSPFPSYQAAASSSSVASNQ